MPRTALTAIVLLILLCPAGWAIDPHVDPSTVLVGCPACHLSHGLSRSPMLPAPQREVCFGCHDTQAKANRQIGEGVLTSIARPQLLSPVFAQPYVHPVDREAYSRRQSGVVTCTSCHSAHRENRQLELATDAPTGQRKLSPRDPTRFEFQLCQSCHGAAGVTTQSLVDKSRLTNPNNRSYHPVEAPSIEGSPSVIDGLRGREINCTDCHGNSDPEGPRGPHGSSVIYILRRQYTTADGTDESPRAYALCYECHDRLQVLESSSFALHMDHVVEKRASCATCHNPHGSVDNRALIRFGEETFVGGVSPSIRTGQLAFVSSGPGSGACFLTCHGFDHAPETYGPAPPVSLTTETTGLVPLLGTQSMPGDPARIRPGKRPKKPPPD